MADSSVAQERSSFYVYVIFRPDGTPCYVGKGHGRRADHHRRFTRNRHLKNLFAKYGDLPIARVREHLTDAEACATEIALIAAIGRRDLGTGPLINLTIGGDGAAGHIRTPEMRAKLSAALKGRKFTAEHLKAMSLSRLGKKRDPASCAKQAATMTGRKRPEQSAALKGRPRPEVATWMRGRKFPEQSAKMTDNKRGARLLEEQVIAIFQRAHAGERQTNLAAEFGVSKSLVSVIVNAKRWKNILAPLKRN